MKFPDDVVIAEEKLTRYQLVWRASNDESGFLARAGYKLSNWQVLENNLRRLAVSAGAVFEGSNDFGELLSICGQLRGPDGIIQKVKTIWIRLSEVNETRFVTLGTAHK